MSKSVHHEANLFENDSKEINLQSIRSLHFSSMPAITLSRVSGFFGLRPETVDRHLVAARFILVLLTAKSVALHNLSPQCQ